jgi:hypothetical protein
MVWCCWRRGRRARGGKSRDRNGEEEEKEGGRRRGAGEGWWL